MLAILLYHTRSGFRYTKTVYLDIKIGSDAPKRIEIGLFGNHVNKTAENFYHLCKCDLAPINNGTQLCYAGSPFHRIIPGFVIQGGDYIKHDGSGSLSIYGKDFEDERFVIKHASAGYVSMANAGPNSNGSQFFITLAATPWLDKRHVAFGKVTKGIEVLSAIEKAVASGAPATSIVISGCGEV